LVIIDEIQAPSFCVANETSKTLPTGKELGTTSIAIMSFTDAFLSGNAFSSAG
jgi:hypothetical protein